MTDTTAQILHEALGRLNDERDRLVADLERADAAIARVSEMMNGDAPAEDAPKHAKAKPSPKRTKGGRTAAPSASSRLSNTELSRRQSVEIVALARSKGEVTAADVAELLGIAKSTAASKLKRLTSNAGGGLGRLSAAGGTGGPGNPKRYAPREADAAPPDSNGARTGQERKVVEALAAASAPLTTALIAANTGIRSVDAASILGGLERRGVIRAVPQADGSPRSWAPAREAEAG